MEGILKLRLSYLCRRRSSRYRSRVRRHQQFTTEFKNLAATHHTMGWLIDRSRVRRHQQFTTEFKNLAATHHTMGWLIDRSRVRRHQQFTTEFKNLAATHHTMGWLIYECIGIVTA